MFVVLEPNRLGLFRVAPKGDEVEGCAAWLFPKIDMVTRCSDAIQDWKQTKPRSTMTAKELLVKGEASSRDELFRVT